MTGTNGRKMIGGTVGGVVGKTDPGRRRRPWRKPIDGNGRSNKKSRRGSTLLQVTVSDQSSHLNVGCSKLHHQVMEPVKIVGESSEAGAKGGTKATA